MKTKAEIVQNLLNEGKITAEDAVVLLMNDKENVRYILYPQWPSFPPYNPYPVYVGPQDHTSNGDYFIVTQISHN